MILFILFIMPKYNSTSLITPFLENFLTENYNIIWKETIKILLEIEPKRHEDLENLLSMLVIFQKGQKETF